MDETKVLKKATKRAAVYWDGIVFGDAEMLPRPPKSGNFTVICSETTGMLRQQGVELIKLVLYYEALSKDAIKTLKEGEVAELAQQYLGLIVDVAKETGKAFVHGYPDVPMRDYLSLHHAEFAAKMLLCIYSRLAHHYESTEGLDDALKNYEDNLPI